MNAKQWYQRRVAITAGGCNQHSVLFVCFTLFIPFIRSISRGMTSKKTTNLAVVGAGVVGLSTAVQLQTAFPEARVVIIADRFIDDTTSYGAAGIFRPTFTKTPGVPLNRLMKWLRDSWNHYSDIALSKFAGKAGVEIISGYQFIDSEPNQLEESLLFHYEPLNAREMKLFHNNPYKSGWFATTMVVECPRYLPFLTQKFVDHGGSLIKKKITSFEELVDQYDAVVNCTGLGSRSLLNDTKLIPNRGHVLKVRAPWLKHFFYAGEQGVCYIIPGVDLVTVGGTRTNNDEDLTPRPEDTKRILSEACKVVPSLEGAEIVREWVGLRPHREPLRVESEIMEFPSGKLKIVHNYGHGAEGISLSWGTSVNAVELVREALTAQDLPHKFYALRSKL